jgi:2-haloacid dehalogenase
MLESVRACVFDAYGTLLDIHSAVSQNSASVGEVADAFSSLWRQRQLEYTWTRSLMNQYADFWELTKDALEYALERFRLHDDGLKESLMNSYLELAAYPDAADTLQKIRSMGRITAVLSNGTPHMLREALQANHLSTYFDACLSVDELKVYKPDPRVYELACNRLGVLPQQVCFVSANAWDLAGAASFGFNTVWINRDTLAREYKFASLHSEQRSLSEVPALLAAGSVATDTIFGS